MRRMIIVCALVLVFALGAVSSAFAATTQNYSLIVPRFAVDKYSSSKTVSAYRDFGVQHKYSGGKVIYFTVCNTSKQPIGPKVAIYPGGSTAPLIDLWYNNSASAKSIVVRLETALSSPVDALAEGTWVWNY